MVLELITVPVNISKHFLRSAFLACVDMAEIGKKLFSFLFGMCISFFKSWHIISFFFAFFMTRVFCRLSQWEMGDMAQLIVCLACKWSEVCFIIS